MAERRGGPARPQSVARGAEASGAGGDAGPPLVPTVGSEAPASLEPAVAPRRGPPRPPISVELSPGDPPGVPPPVCGHCTPLAGAPNGLMQGSCPTCQATWLRTWLAQGVSVHMAAAPLPCGHTATHMSPACRRCATFAERVVEILPCTRDAVAGALGGLPTMVALPRGSVPVVGLIRALADGLVRRLMGDGPASLQFPCALHAACLLDVVYGRDVVMALDDSVFLDFQRAWLGAVGKADWWRAPAVLVVADALGATLRGGGSGLALAGDRERPRSVRLRSVRRDARADSYGTRSASSSRSTPREGDRRSAARRRDRSRRRRGDGRSRSH